MTLCDFCKNYKDERCMEYRELSNNICVGFKYDYIPEEIEVKIIDWWNVDEDKFTKHHCKSTSGVRF